MPQSNNRVLLVHSIEARDANADQDFRIAPIGLFFLAGALKAKGFPTMILPTHLPLLNEESYQLELAEQIKSFDPGYIGYSFRNLYRLSPPGPGAHSLKEFFTVSREIPVLDFLRRCSNVAVIGGGAAFSLAPDMYMDLLDLDYGIRGEGEHALPLLLDKLNRGESPTDIPGLVFKDKGRIQKNNLSRAQDTIQNPMDLSGLFKLKSMYYDNGGYGSVQTKRGCAFACSYCLYPHLEGTHYRLRPVSLIMEELASHVHDLGISHIYFVDSVFSSPPEHSRDIAESIIKQDLRLHWYAYVNPRHLTPDLLRTYRDSGCSGLVLTLDSGSDPMLNRLGKGFHTHEAIEAVNHLKEASIPFEVAMIIGSPGETEATMNETFSFCRNLLESVPVTFTPGVWMHPASPVYKKQYTTLPQDEDRLSRLVLDDQLAEHNSLHFFFSDHEPARRGSLIKSFISETSGEPLWFVIGKDMVPDAEKGIMAFPSTPGIKRYARPWFSGLGKESKNHPLRESNISEVSHV